MEFIDVLYHHKKWEAIYFFEQLSCIRISGKLLEKQLQHSTLEISQGYVKSIIHPQKAGGRQRSGTDWF